MLVEQGVRSMSLTDKWRSPRTGHPTFCGRLAPHVANDAAVASLIHETWQGREQANENTNQFISDPGPPDVKGAARPPPKLQAPLYSESGL